MIDLLIVNYNTRHLLARLLETLKEDHRDGEYTIHIIDNGSQDDSAEFLRARADKYPIDNIIFGENIGYSAAINKLAAKTNSEILCAVNADTWFTTNHVSQVSKSFSNHIDAAVIGVKQLDEGNTIRHGGIFWDGMSHPVHRGWSMHDPGDVMFKDVVKCWTVSGSIYYVRRSAWEDMSAYPAYKKLFPDHNGAFLPTPMYFEETFCSQLAHHLGYDVLYDGSIETAGHTWNASTGSHDSKLRGYFEQSRQIYIDACNALNIPHEC